MSTKEYIGILFYDISINSAVERKYYNVFRKEILKRDFISYKNLFIFVDINIKKKVKMI